MNVPDQRETGGPDSAHPKLSSSLRDRDDLRRRLETWLTTKLNQPEITSLDVPERNGISSETLLFEVAHTQDGAQRTLACAARLSPDPDALPVFPVYDLDRQYHAMRLVGERTTVPIPETFWFEADEKPLGTPFFVMRRIEGRVPPDVMPYTFGSWLSEASAEDQQHLQQSAVRVLADIHTMETKPADIAFLELDRPGETALRRHVADLAAYYEWVASDGVRSPLIERALVWIEDNWPEDEGDTVISWGDARIGNMMFQGFEPVAVLDWEMAAVGPAEVDVGWMIYLHRFLDDIALSAGMPGMVHFMRRDEVASTYESMTGHAPRDLDFYTLYAALRHAVIMSRIARRQVLFGEISMPDDPDDTILHRASLEQMLEGTYWRQFETN